MLNPRTPPCLIIRETTALVSAARYFARGGACDARVRSLRSRVSERSVPRLERTPRGGEGFLRRGVGAVVRHAPRGRPQLSARQAAGAQLPSRDVGEGGGRGAALSPLAGVLGQRALEPPVDRA